MSSTIRRNNPNNNNDQMIPNTPGTQREAKSVLSKLTPAQITAMISNLGIILH